MRRLVNFPAGWQILMDAALFSAGVQLLLGAWWLLFHNSALCTGLLFVPWDVAIERPPLGSWERTVNGFFEDPMGEKLFSISLVFMSGAALAFRFRGARNRTGLVFAFALTSLLAALLSYPVLMAGLVGVVVLAHFFPVASPGFHYTLFPVTLLTVFFIGLPVIQAKFPINRLIPEAKQPEA